ncbi:MAG: hypothetical protein LBT36_05810 [Oscillospiraceae bacterium]|jgi:hypothetical protein|nr:hypothetical protein [Oscillospiraceae bacterium]
MEKKRRISQRAINIFEFFVSLIFISYEAYIFVHNGFRWITVLILVLWVIVLIWCIINLVQNEPEEPNK